MTETQKKAGIQLADDSYCAAPVPVEIPQGGGIKTLYVHELGYMRIRSIYANAAAEGGQANAHPLALIMKESVRDAEGNTFTLEEVLDLRPAVAEPLTAAVVKVHDLARPAKEPEKN